MSSYPSTSDEVRRQLQQLVTMPDEAREWQRFLRHEMRMPPWLLPALQAAVRERVWEGSRDPYQPIRGAVHRIAKQMRLSSGNQPLFDADEETP